ncbi:MAG: AAA family ATPase [Oscillospiraceae bacterium]|nr:AAA family ATPase [Oscillospiraceae bacterium]
MGTYFNPSNGGFRKTVSDEIYVDKSGLLNILNKKIGAERNCISVSHARRFGKSQAARMIDAYYSRGCDSRELFSGLKISESEDFEKYLNKYNVIYFDISSFADFYKETLVSEIIRHLYDDIKEIYPELDYSKTISSVLKQVYNKSENIPFVIIVDEWDCVVRNFSDRPDLVHEYLQFLHSLFKSEESHEFLALGYITGILPIKKIDDESALNNFFEYTMTDSAEFTTYFGFTEKEVEMLCHKYDMNINSVKDWYNGYLINEEHMYNPNSVYMAMVRHSLESYWKNTSAFNTINTFISLDFDGLKSDIMKMLAGDSVYVDIKGFENDLSMINSKNDALTALIHLGYLGYDKRKRTAYIPNYEVKEAYQSALAKGKWSEISKSISRCEELLFATINGDSDKVAELLELSHETYTSIFEYNSENSLSCVITMAYFTAPAYYTVIRELPSGKGFADIALIPRADSDNMPAMIIELKWDKDVDTAIKQIKEKRYTGVLKWYEKEIILVGVNYNKETKKHECSIEKVYAC